MYIDNILKILACIVFIATVFFITFSCGKLYGLYKQRPVLVEQRCAHYDTASGDFTYGPPPYTLLIPPVLSKKGE